MNGMNTRINEIKGSIQSLWQRVRKGEENHLSEEDSGFDYERNYEDDLPLRLAREDGPGVRYYSTENNPLSRGAEKVEAAGIDSFGEDDSIDPEEDVPFSHGI